MGAPRRQGSPRARARRHAAGLRRPAAGLRRHGAVRDPHVQPDHRRQRRSIRGRRRSRTITSSSPAATTTTSRRRSGARSPGARPREAVLRDARRRHLPLLLPRAGTRDARAVHPRRRLAQPRLRRVRRRRHRRRLDDARLRLGDGYVYFTLPKARRVVFTGALQPWVERQGHRARAAAALGRAAVAGHVGRVRRSTSSSCRSRIATRSRT